MNDISTAAIKDRTQVIKRPTYIEIRYVDMPVFMRCEWLDKAGSFLAALWCPSLQQASLFENPVHTARRNGNNVIIEHHEGEAAIPLIRIGSMVFDNAPSFPLLKPKITRDQTIMLVDLAVALLPATILAG